MKTYISEFIVREVFAGKRLMSDLDHADANNVSINSRGEPVRWKGDLASNLIHSIDFKVSPFAFSVWRVEESACTLIANQSTLEGALRYMASKEMVLVHNEAFLELDGTFSTDNTVIKYERI